MFMILHMFNESSSKGAAAAAKFQLPRGAVWTAFSGEVAEIAFQSKGYRCETWPADVRKYCDGAGFQYKSYDPGELSAALIKYNVQTVQGTHMEDGRQITCDWFENMYLSEEHAVAAAAVEMVVDDDNSTST